MLKNAIIIVVGWTVLYAIEILTVIAVVVAVGWTISALSV